MSNLCQEKGEIPRHPRTLSKVLDTPDIKRLGRFILELKQHREDKLQSVNHNHLNIHQHVTNINFQEQGVMMNKDTPTPLGLSLDVNETRPSINSFLYRTCYFTRTI